MSEIQVAESSTPTKRARAPKVLDHLELHPKMGGGHIVKHVYTDYEDKPLEVHFNKEGKAKGGEHILSHLSKHGGLPGLESYDKHAESETDDEIDD
jgi:hypothetical protein